MLARWVRTHPAGRDRGAGPSGKPGIGVGLRCTEDCCATRNRSLTALWGRDRLRYFCIWLAMAEHRRKDQVLRYRTVLAVSVAFF